MKPLDLTNKRVGRLTALFPIIYDAAPVWWLVKCDCGTEKPMIGSEFNRSRTRSCGCLQRETGSNKKQWRGCGNISGNLWSGIKFGAKHRHLDFEITIEQAWKKFLQQKGLCKITGVPIILSDSASGGRECRSNRTASLDRIDSTKGYIAGNFQWVHKKINKMKWDLTDKEFIDWCKLVAKNNE